ncbi:MAG: hypothetical protein J2P25_10615 [Nocardiopsaceae bacterium]|nr:hypothetical protein [Nocardiopsaceae bacterium]
MRDRLGQFGEGDGLPAGVASLAAHDQGGRDDIAVVRESAVEPPDLAVLRDDLWHDCQILLHFGAGDRVLQDDPEKPAGHASGRIGVYAADEGDERLEVRARRDLPASPAGPVGWNRPVDRDRRLVDGDRVVGRAAARRPQGHEPAEAVPEDQPGAGGRADRLDVLALAVDAVLVALRAAAAPSAALHQVHGMPSGQERGEGCQAGSRADRSVNDDDRRTVPRAEVFDSGAVCGGYYPGVQVRHDSRSPSGVYAMYALAFVSSCSIRQQVVHLAHYLGFRG